MGRIKVLMAGPDREVHGGISAVVNELYSAGLDEKVELKYIGTMKEGSKLKKLFVAAFAYARFLKELPWCDVAHVHFSSDASFFRKAYFIRAAHRKGKKIVLHQHGGDFKTFYGQEISEKKKKFVRDILSMGDVMLVLTSGWKDYFSKLTDAERIVVFPNGIKISGKDQNVGVSEMEKDYNSVLFLGRICKDKGIDELLDAMKEIHMANKDAHLYIGGIYEEEIYRKKIEECNGFVTYLGWIKDKEKDNYLNKCGILVLPSYYEGFPVSIIEAMYAGSAVVASNVGGIPEIIQDGVDGTLISPKDSAALRDAILKLMNDNELAKSYGLNGKQKVLKNYSVEKNIERLTEIYNKLMN